MKKLKQIEFNEELIGKEGIVINFRKPDVVPPEVFVSEHRKAAGFLYITAINENGTFYNVSKHGKFIEGENKNEDLLMYQEVESRVFYVNEYEEGLGLICHTKEEAISANLKSVYRGVYIRTIKLVEEIE
jgi:hypothetical protein